MLRAINFAQKKLWRPRSEVSRLVGTSGCNCTFLPPRSVGVKHASTAAVTITPRSSVEEVCAWASEVGQNGVSDKSVSILQREEIDGEAVFEMTDTMLEKFGMAAGARIKLLNAITLLRGKFSLLFRVAEVTKF